jgi:raffinose/stachyose/melibiose transport system substrate-binding protein
MKKKISLLFSLFMVTAMLLTACGGTAQETAAPSGDAPAAGGTITLNLFHKWPEPEALEFFKLAIDTYQERNPNVKIIQEAASDEAYKDKIRVLMASNEVPDIFFTWAGEFSWKFSRAGQTLDLTDYVNGSTWKDEVVMSAVQPFEFKDRIYGIPLRINAKFMAYNKEIFEANGLQVPTTWDEFLAVCETLKNANIVPIAFGNEFPWASSHYVGDFNAKLVPPEVISSDYLLTGEADTLFTHPGYIEALKRFQTLGDSGYFNKGMNGISHSNARSSFIAGKAAMFYLELEEFQTLADGKEGDWFGFFQLPGGTGGEGDQKLITGAPDGFMISKNTKYPDEAAKFLQFLTGPEMGAKYVEMLGIPSAAVGAVTPENALPSVVEGLNQINAASGMALWMDTDMDVRIVEVYLPGLQALLMGTNTPEALMQSVHDIAVKVQEAIK